MAIVTEELGEGCAKSNKCGSKRPQGQHGISRLSVAGVPVSLINMDMACDEVVRRHRSGQGGYCVFRDINGVVGANDDLALMRAHQNAILVAPDGMPLVWLARLKGCKWVDRVYGPDFMLEFCRISARLGLRHYFYGSTDSVLEKLTTQLLRNFPDLKICGTYSPPMRPASEANNLDDVERIRAARPDVVWVGLGTPKQELWMQANSPHLDGTLLMGVGAAFDFHAKVKFQAPRWMQRAGLEWSFRLMCEPRRLGRRYLIGIPRLAFLLVKRGCQLT
jgi:N-acetylglucosaminyldiphosphoundecaprenol N-acetyl-beta-D-mannosaminyltransferase